MAAKLFKSISQFLYLQTQRVSDKWIIDLFFSPNIFCISYSLIFLGGYEKHMRNASKKQ